MTQTTDQIGIGGLSIPEQATDTELLQFVAVEHARMVLDLFLASTDWESQSQVVGVAELLRRWCERGIGFGPALDVGISEALRAIRAEANPSSTAALLAVCATKDGTIGSWECSVVGAVPIFWDRWLLPSVTTLQIDSDGITARVSLTDTVGNLTSAIVAASSGDGLARLGAVPLPVFGTARSLIVLPARTRPATISNSVGPFVKNPNAAIVATCSGAISLLDCCASDYSRWVQAVLRRVLLVESPDGRIRSGSFDDHPGTVYFSIHDNPAPMAESLIHEASHQYFHLASRLGAIDDGSDVRLFYSAATRTNRPLNRILLAYHAFGNVLLLYRLLRRAGGQVAEYVARNEEAVVDLVTSLEVPLRGNPALTAVGRSLFIPLFKKLHL